MINRAFVWSLVICGVLLGEARVAGAQADPENPPPMQPTDGMSPGQLNQLFDAMLVMQAQDRLSLNEQQYGQFLARLRVLQETRRRSDQERGRRINELNKLSNPSNPAVAESELKVRLAALQELEARSAAELRKAYIGIDEVLTPVQQARFRVLEEQIERRKLELIARARLNNQLNRPNPNRPNANRPAVRRPPGR